MSDTKQKYESSLVEDFAFSNNSEIYKYINSIVKTDALPMTMYYELQTASCDLDKATLFNQFFKSVYSEPNICTMRPSQVCETLGDINIDPQEVYTALSSLNPHKAYGIDSIGPKILKTCCLGLYEVLHHLFTLSLSSSTIPAEWKIHCIVPIFKSGDRRAVKNYRPISLLCSVSKTGVLNDFLYPNWFSQTLLLCTTTLMLPERSLICS